MVRDPIGIAKLPKGGYTLERAKVPLVEYGEAVRLQDEALRKIGDRRFFGDLDLAAVPERDQPEPVRFYTQLERLIGPGGKFSVRRMPIRDFANLLNGAGVTADELKWSGIVEMLDEMAPGQVKVSEGKIAVPDEAAQIAVEREAVALRLLDGALWDHKITREYYTTAGGVLGLKADGTPSYQGMQRLTRNSKYVEQAFYLPSSFGGYPLHISISHYTSVHSRRSALGHMRWSENNGSVFIEEVQSDHIQRGHSQGWARDDAGARTAELAAVIALIKERHAANLQAAAKSECI